MGGKISSIPIGEKPAPFVLLGPLLDELLNGPVGDFEAYLEAGGYDVARQVLNDYTSEEIACLLEAAGLRGRAGGGFPTGHKWAIAGRTEAEQRFFVCNAHAAQPGGFKERYLLRANPHKVIEALMVAAHGVDAGTAILFLGRDCEPEEALLRQALEEVKAQGLLDVGVLGSPRRLEIIVFRSPGGYITGEETAILELLEGRPGRPRRKPPVPAMTGLWKCPTVVNNLETTLQAFMIFPGGVSSRALGSTDLDVPLDYDSLQDAGSDLGSGTLIVVAEGTSMVDLAIDIQSFFHDNSCGKCQPCKGGTGRTLTMLSRLEDLDQRSIDWIGRQRPESPRQQGGLYVIQDDAALGGVSYTDSAQGLDKIIELCQFYEHRGDCHHTTEAARGILRLLGLFTEEFEARRSSVAKLETQESRGRRAE